MKEIIFTTLLCICNGLLVSILAQEGQLLLSDDDILQANYPYEYVKEKPQRAFPINSRSKKASLPFFDDFSNEGLFPLASLWDLGDTSNVPLITHGLAINPPSRGVLSFDGASANGLVYSRSLDVGLADRLVSLPIDLSGFTSGDNVVLTFFLQAQGRGNAPEAEDLFTVWFKNSNGEFEEVFSTEGRNVEPFEQIVIRVDNVEFLHSDFQMAFENIGSLNGYLDQWHLDYLFLDANRVGVNENTTYLDVSPVNIEGSPLNPFTAIPLNIFQNFRRLFQPFSILVSNLDGNSINGNLELILTDPIGGRNFDQGGLINAPFTVGPTSVEIISIDQAFDDQIFDQVGAYEISLSTSLNNDTREENDNFTIRFPIDSVLAFDDGEADAAYGTNNARGFGIRVNSDEPVLLTAVWMSFVPSIFFNPNTNQSTDLEGIPFRLAVWNESDPDSIIYRQLDGTRVVYGETIDHFERFELTEPQLLSGTFWVGMQQLDGIPISLGFDLTYDNDELCFWDSLGTWTSTRLGGTFMIRPEFAQGDISTSLNSSFSSKSESMKIFPMPIDDGHWIVAVSVPGSIQSVRTQLYNLEGKQVLKEMIPEIKGNHLHYFLPESIELPKGIYIQQQQLEMRDGTYIVYKNKLYIQ